MTGQTWQQACDCKGAKATSGRIVLKSEYRGAYLHVDAELHPEPVCDSCNTPWTPVTPGASACAPGTLGRADFDSVTDLDFDFEAIPTPPPHIPLDPSPP